MSRLGKALPALLAAGLGVLLFYVGRDGRWWLSLLVILALGAIGLLLRWAGEARVAESARGAVVLLEGWLLAVIAAGAAFTLLVTLGGVALEDWLTAENDKDNEYVKAIAGVASGALTAAAAVLFTKDFDDSTGGFWPSSLWRRRVQKVYGSRFSQNTPAWQAVYSDRLTGANNAISGWGLGARLARGRLIDKRGAEVQADDPAADFSTG